MFSSLKQAVYIGTIAVCTLLIFNGNFSVGFLVACSNYVLKIMNQLTQINMMLFVMQQQTVAGQKIKAFFEKPASLLALFQEIHYLKYVIFTLIGTTKVFALRKNFALFSRSSF